MASFKVPQAYRPDPGQLVMVPDQSTVAETRTGARMVWVGIIIGGAFIAAAVLWTVNLMLESSVAGMIDRNRQLDERVRLADQQILAFQERASFFGDQTARVRNRNAALQREIDRQDPSGPRYTPPSPRRSVPPSP